MKNRDEEGKKNEQQRKRRKTKMKNNENKIIQHIEKRIEKMNK